jgi:poly-gamma-glutamate synthesis protein (capsule biosynthesis protein)
MVILAAASWTAFAADTSGQQAERLPFSSIALSQSEASLALLMEESQAAELLFTGDMMFHMPQIEGARLADGSGYDFAGSFEAIAPLVEGADLAIANLETTLSGSRLPYRGYPQFNTPDEAAQALKAAGFDVLTTANNHSVDGGRQGLVRTLEVLDALGFEHTGTKRPEEEGVLVVEVEGIRFAMINGTYGLNGLESYLTAEERMTMIRMIGDGSGITAEIQAVRPLVDFVIVMPHWGYEYQRQPSSSQKRMASDWLDAGADAIIGSHPHVIQPMEIDEDGRFIAYSLGNAISNQRERPGKPAYWQYTEDGVLLKLQVVKNPWTGETKLEGVRAIPTHVERLWTGEKWSHKIIPALADDPETGRSWQRTAEQIPGQQNSQNLSEIVMNV